MIYGFFTNIEWFSKEECEVLEKSLGEEDIRNILRFKQVDDQKRALLSFVGTNEVLKKFGVTRDLLKVNPYGKKYVDLKGKHFSVSHSGSWVVHSICNKSLGVDIQKMRPRNYQALGASLAMKKEEFYRTWTAKEAYVKYLGIGLRKELESFEVIPKKQVNQQKPCAYIQSFLFDEYALAFCSEGNEEVQMKNWDFLNRDKKKENCPIMEGLKELVILEKEQTL